MAVTIDGTGGITFPNSTVQASAGSVLQVVNATYSTSTSTTSTSYSDTGLTLSITPKFSTSKVLVIVNQNGLQKAASAAGAINLQLLRGATNLGVFDRNAAYTGTAIENIVASSSYCYLDSPATTSSTTYKTQFSSREAGSSVSVQITSAISTITLMEIAG
jgi:hypothetical protein